MGIKSWVARRAAQEVGKQIVSQKGGPAMKAWLLAHKAPIGGVFVAAWGWAMLSGCPPLFGAFDLTRYVSCEHAKDALGMLGALLVGAGVLKSDQFHKDRATEK